MQHYDAIIIGGGHNGLVTSAYLAKAGKKILLLERRATVGGVVATEEIFPGFKFNTFAHRCDAFAKTIIEELTLTKFGLELMPADPLLFAPLSDGNSLLIPREPAKITAEISRFSKTDATQFSSFSTLVKKFTSFLQELNQTPRLDPTSPKAFDLLGWIKLGLKFRGLGKKDMYEFLRILPMSIADFLNEWFETEILKSTLAVQGLLGGFVGPRAQGTSYVFLHHLGNSDGIFRNAGQVRGGVGNLPHAIARAAQSYGAEIRNDSEVAAVVTKNGAATAVALANGDEIAAPVIISSVDIKKTFLKLVEPTYLEPHFLLQVRNIRSRGTVAKVNLALDGLPKFKFASEHGSLPHHGAVIHIGPTMDDLERAADAVKYGGFSRHPFLEITIPSAIDSTLAPAGKHVMSVWTQYAPYHLRDGNWDQQRDTLGDLVVDTIEEHAPGFKSSILHRRVLTPLDLERTFGLTEGHLDHGELALDQIFFMRPLPGWACYRTPIQNLYLCGSGTHPGGGITGLAGYYAAKEILRAWPKT